MTRNIQLSLPADPVTPQGKKKRKTKIMTRNFQLSYLNRPIKARKEKEKRK